MPGQRGIDIVEQAGTHHEGFARATLLARAAIIANGSWKIVRLHILGKGDRRHQRTDAKQVVAAAMSCGTVDHGFMRSYICDLAHAGQRVEFPQEGDDGLTGTKIADEGRIHARNSAPHGETIVFKRPCENFRRTRLLEFQFGKIPDAVAELREIRLHHLDRFGDRHHGLMIHGMSSHCNSPFRQGVAHRPAIGRRTML